MNITAANVSVLTLALGALAGGIEKLTSGDWQIGGALIVVGIVLIWVYEKLPLSTPPTPPDDLQ